MSHSKMTKRGRSQYVESWNPAAKKYIIRCKCCGSEGYSPSVDEPDFCIDPIRRAIASELTRIYKRLDLDELGRCSICKKIQDK